VGRQPRPGLHGRRPDRPQPSHLPDRRLGPLDPPPRPRRPLIGVCGLVPFQHGPGVELLYSLAPTHWSKGLATEAATAVLTHAFDTLGLPAILATTDDANEASLRLLTRLGATLTTRLQIGPHTYPCFTIHPPDDPGMLP
jgi:RimJ/RimL family protein N-acetyltransferase